MRDETHMTRQGEEERPLGLALRRGWRRQCPACGCGAMLKGYLTVRRTCPACGEELFHHRADDGPSWATLMIAGHLMAPLLYIVYATWRPEPWVMAIGFSLLFISLSLYLLPRIKGAIVGFQWARRLHGFGAAA
jgi:uncharacterized protein (DUF983 family)